MALWVSDLEANERNTLFACFTGWTLDAMDGQLFSFAMGTLIAAWGISTTQAGFLGSVVLISSALGGWLAGIMSDRFGRVRTLQITVLWYAVFTGLLGLAQNYEQLFALRVVQGIGFGGEWTAGAVLLGEVIRDRYRGRAGGLLQSGWAIGYGLATLTYMAFFSLFEPTVAWRYLFIVGIIPALLVFWIRSHVGEPEVYKRSKVIGGAATRNSVARIFRRPLLSITARATLLTIGAQGGGNTFLVWMPTYLSKGLGLSVVATGSFTLVLVLSAFVGYNLGGFSSDKLGRRLTFITFGIGAALAIPALTFLAKTSLAVLVFEIPLGLFAFGVLAPMVSYLAELYPTSVRGTGQGWCYNAGRGIGALFPLGVGYMAATMPMAEAIGILGTAAYLLVVVAALMLPETAGRTLLDVEDGTPLGLATESARLPS